MKRFLVLLILMAVSCSEVYAASCEEALVTVFGNEGGYQNYKNDTGNFRLGKNCGGTKFGLTCRDHKGIDIKNLTKERAASIYTKDQCAQLRFTELEGQKIPTKFLDLAVNMGTGTSINLFLKTLNRLNGIDLLPVNGVMSEEAIQIYNYYTQDKDQRSIFYLTLILTALDRYTDIVKKNPKQGAWLLSWIIRLNPYSD